MYENIYMPVQTIQEATIKSGGLCSIKLFRHEDVLTWPVINPLTGIISSSITLKPGKSIYLLPSVDQTRSFTEEENFDSAGAFYEINVKAETPGSNAANILSLQTMMHHRWGIIAEDNNGVTRLIGNADSGARLIKKYTSGDKKSSRKTELTFAWANAIGAPIYTAEAFDIVIGGITQTAGCLTLIKRFRVGDPGEMTDADTTLTLAGFANKNLLVIAGSLALPCDDGSGDIDWTGSIERHYEKTYAGDTITYIGGVTDNEIHEIYAFT